MKRPDEEINVYAYDALDAAARAAQYTALGYHPISLRGGGWRLTHAQEHTVVIRIDAAAAWNDENPTEPIAPERITDEVRAYKAEHFWEQED